MPEYFVWWNDITQDDVDSFVRALDRASNERDMQAFLEKAPLLLIQHLGGGHGRWVIPQKRLGAEYVPDFVVGQCDSSGFEWQIVELESPLAKMFTKSGDPSRALNHAIRQIADWRAWLKRNQDYAARPREHNGLGLVDIDSSARGLIVIGRRDKLDPATKERRRQLSADLRIDIHTYDWLVSRSQGRIEALARLGTDRPS